MAMGAQGSYSLFTLYSMDSAYPDDDSPFSGFASKIIITATAIINKSLGGTGAGPRVAFWGAVAPQRHMLNRRWTRKTQLPREYAVCVWIVMYNMTAYIQVLTRRYAVEDVGSSGATSPQRAQHEQRHSQPAGDL